MAIIRTPNGVPVVGGNAIIAPDNVFSDADVATLENLAGTFDAKPINVGGNVVMSIRQGKTYYPNPWMCGDGHTDKISFFDENMTEIEFPATVPDGGFSKSGLGVKSRRTTWFEVTENIVKVWCYYHTYREFTLDPAPAYIKIDGDWTIGKFTERVPLAKKTVHYNTDDCTGLFEQIDTMVNTNAIALFNTLNYGIVPYEYGRFLKSQMVHAVNDMRHAIRLASYNIYGADRSTRNWASLKEYLQGKGIDIIGFQEVKDASGTVAETFPAALSSWDLSTFATTAQHYGTAIGANGKFTVASTSEHDYTTNGNEIRRYTKTELYLPMYKHRWWSEHLKISVYCTQWALAKSIAVAQAAELAEVMSADKNPFIVLMADTNDDFSFDRETWKVMNDAGFRPLFDLESATLAVGRDPIDNIFVNNRITSIETNVVDGTNVKYNNAGNLGQMSDHDLIYADVKLNCSDIICVKNVAYLNSAIDTEHCVITSSNGHPDWFERNTGTITYTFTPTDGYTLNSISAYDIVSVDSESYPSGIVTVSGNSVTIDTSRVFGDMALNATISAT